MDREQIQILIQLLLKKKKIAFVKGLTDKEILTIESDFNFSFPPDLREFLQTEMPVSNGFVNWRNSITSLYEKKI